MRRCRRDASRARAGGRHAPRTPAAQLIWLAIYFKVSKPLNAKMADAARTGTAPSDGSGWQARWEAVLLPRSLLMGLALLALLLAIAGAR
jgi:hypothetical protein